MPAHRTPTPRELVAHPRQVGFGKRALELPILALTRADLPMPRHSGDSDLIAVDGIHIDRFGLNSVPLPQFVIRTTSQVAPPLPIGDDPIGKTIGLRIIFRYVVGIELVHFFDVLDCPPEERIPPERIANRFVNVIEPVRALGIKQMNH